MVGTAVVQRSAQPPAERRWAALQVTGVPTPTSLECAETAR